MFQLEVPGQWVSILPNPRLGDSRNLTSTMNYKEAMDGTIQTHAKKTDLALYNWDFQVTRMKSLEVIAFFKIHIASQVTVTTDKNEVIVGYLKTNPIAVRIDGPSDMVSLSIEFEGDDLCAT